MSSGDPYGNPQQPSPYANGGQFPPPGQYVPPAKSTNTVLIIVLVVVGAMFVLMMLCGVGLLLPAVQAAREAARRMADANNLKQVGLAMHNYAATNTNLPTPIVTNSEGQAVWSWQIPLIPFIEANGTYDKIDFNNMQPYNDPINAFLAERMPPCFGSPFADDGPSSGVTHVFVIATMPDPERPQAAFTIGEYHNFDDFQDGLENTIIAIMLPSRSEPWASPVVLSPEEAYVALQNERRGANVLMADASVHYLTNDIDQETFIGLCTRDGDENVYLP